VDPSPTDVSSKPSPTRLPTTRRKHRCVRRNWYGTCGQWDDEVLEGSKWDL
jgi:hypothetical protein